MHTHIRHYSTGSHIPENTVIIRCPSTIERWFKKRLFLTHPQTTGQYWQQQTFSRFRDYIALLKMTRYSMFSWLTEIHGHRSLYIFFLMNRYTRAHVFVRKLNQQHSGLHSKNWTTDIYGLTGLAIESFGTIQAIRD